MIKKLLAALLPALAAGQTLTVEGARFLMDGEPFAYTGVSFFNALYNAEFNRSEEARGLWLDKFRRYGITVVAVRHGENGAVEMPDPKRNLAADDLLVVVAKTGQVGRFMERLA